MSFTSKRLDAGMSIGRQAGNHDGMKKKIYCQALRLVQKREPLEVRVQQVVCAHH